ncbi:hypothetical protein BJ165DRAFT_633217 [Panaeolus papilionaceus]|nr:hypothetical protein BJ165DRAFT_633217 [Panaeolus papilionaceus]
MSIRNSASPLCMLILVHHALIIQATQNGCKPTHSTARRGTKKSTMRVHLHFGGMLCHRGRNGLWSGCYRYK